MNSLAGIDIAALRETLAGFDPNAHPRIWFDQLVERGFDQLPLPASGHTLTRWQALATVARHDLSLAKLYEGHTDALAILRELGSSDAIEPGQSWGTWAAEPPTGRTVVESDGRGHGFLRGTKQWCSGAEHLSHGLLTAWHTDGRGPQLVRVAMRQPAIRVVPQGWRAVGMAGSASVDIEFDGAAADLVGGVGDYLSRPGFWQGGAGIAACWFGGATGLAEFLDDAVSGAPAKAGNAFKAAALGKVDVALSSVAALLREAAAWIDAHPMADASGIAFRTRLAAESAATRVLDETGRALGAGPFCRNARFARLAADLPVFVRQSHGEQDYAALGERASVAPSEPWTL